MNKIYQRTAECLNRCFTTQYIKQEKLINNLKSVGCPIAEELTAEIFKTGRVLSYISATGIELYRSKAVFSAQDVSDLFYKIKEKRMIIPFSGTIEERAKSIAAIVNTLPKDTYYRAELLRELKSKNCPYLNAVTSLVKRNSEPDGNKLSGTNAAFFKIKTPIYYKVFIPILESAGILPPLENKPKDIVKNPIKIQDKEKVETESVSQPFNIQTIDIKDIIAEIKRRGFSGKLEYKQQIQI